jgi:hypothetical protein
MTGVPKRGIGPVLMGNFLAPARHRGPYTSRTRTMNGTLSQMVALSSAANGVIDGRFNPEDFFPDHADFKFCNAVRFVDIKADRFQKNREVERHRTPFEWLNAIKQVGGSGAWLTFTSTGNTDAPDHQLSAFVGGGGEWRLVVSNKRNAEIWMPRWEVTKQNTNDNRIWTVTYGCVVTTNHVLNVPEPDLIATTSRLQSALTVAREFAGKHDLPSWAEWFQRSIDCLDPTKPLSFPEYVQFLCLDLYPTPAQRLFAAAYNGWVFGGMGSWNDLYFEPRAENDHYNELSAELYSAINESIQHATQSVVKQTPA